MIYLENNTLVQTIYIPRQDFVPENTGCKCEDYEHGYAIGFSDGENEQKSKLTAITITENGSYERIDGWNEVNVLVINHEINLEDKSISITGDTSIVRPSIGYDGMSAVTVDASQYAQDNYDNGFDDGFDDGYASGSSEGYESGFTSGKAYQKALLVSTAFTNNGNYARENGWSSVTVNLNTAATYQEGFESGHTKGMDDQKGLLTSTAFTENGLYTRENGWSGVTVDVQPPLENKNVSISADTTEVSTSQGYYGMSAVTVDAIEYGQEKYSQGYNIGFTSGENNVISTFTSMTATTNGEYGSSAAPLSSITVDIPFTSITITENTAITVSDKAYTGITVNVSNIDTNFIHYCDYVFAETLSANTTDCYIDTNIHPTTATTFRVKGYRRGYNQNKFVVGHLGNGEENNDYNLTWFNSGDVYTHQLVFDFQNASIIKNSYFASTGYTDLTCGNNYIYDNLSGTTAGTGTRQTSINDQESTIKVDCGSWWLKSLEINEGQNVLFNGVAAYDENGNIGLFDSITQTMFTPSLANKMSYKTNNIEFCDYIASYSDVYTDGNIIDTNIIPTVNTKMRIVGRFYKSSPSFIVGNDNSTEYCAKLRSQSQHYYFVWSIGGTNFETEITSMRNNSNVFDYELNNKSIYNGLNNSKIGSSESATCFTGVTSIRINTMPTNLSLVQIWENDTLVFDGHAAINRETEDIGLFDTVTQTMFVPINSLGQRNQTIKSITSNN